MVNQESKRYSIKEIQENTKLVHDLLFEFKNVIDNEEIEDLYGLEMDVFI